MLAFVAQSLRDWAPVNSFRPANAHSFDHGTPRGIAGSLSGHTVITAWSRVGNGFKMAIC